jgi:hypothetical protein
MIDADSSWRSISYLRCFFFLVRKRKSVRIGVQGVLQIGNKFYEKVFTLLLYISIEATEATRKFFLDRAHAPPDYSCFWSSLIP